MTGLGRIKHLPPAYCMATVKRQAAKITEETGVTLEQLCTPSKRRYIVAARWDLWAALMLQEGWTTWRMAHRFNVDHTTALYGLRKWAVDRLGTAPKATLAEIRAAWEAQQMGVAA